MMAKKPGPAKGSKQRPRNGSQKKAPAAGKAPARRKTPQAPSREPAQGKKEQAAGSRWGTLARSPGVRGALAATLVSAAGALLFWRRRDGSNDEPGEQAVSMPAAEASGPKPLRKRGGGGGRAKLPSAGETDALVAAGVTGGGKKKRPSNATPERRARKAVPESSTPASESSDPPGAFPDGSPLGDTVGRTSIEGGPDRTA